MFRKPKKVPPKMLLTAMFGSLMTAFILSVLGASILNLLGARYATHGSLIGFMFLVILLGVFFTPVTGFLEYHLARSKVVKDQVLYVLLDSSLNVLLMFLVAGFTQRVTITLPAAFGTALVFSIWELFLTEKLPLTKSSHDHDRH